MFMVVSVAIHVTACDLCLTLLFSHMQHHILCLSFPTLFGGVINAVLLVLSTTMNLILWNDCCYIFSIEPKCMVWALMFTTSVIHFDVIYLFI